MASFSLPKGRCVCAAVLALVVAGCGGSGGDDSGGSAAPDAFSQRTTTIFAGEPYTPAEVSVDGNGQEIVRTRLVVFLSAAATNDEVDDLLSRYSATITSSLAGSRSLAIRIPDPVTVDALEDIIVTMEGEGFVDAVFKEYVPQLKALPDNIQEGEGADYTAIAHQLAIGGASAWNAREAIRSEPNILLYDFFGGGASQLTSYLDADLAGDVFSGSGTADDHGYHVAGILAGRFGGGSMSPDLVTGVFPGRSRIFIADLAGLLTGSDLEVLLLDEAQERNGTVILSTSLGDDCVAPSISNLTTCLQPEQTDRRALVWINKIRGAGLEDKLLHFVAAGNRERWGGEAAGYDLRDAETASDWNAAALSLTIEDNGQPVDPLTNTLVVENLQINDTDLFSVTPAGVVCLNENSFVGGQIGGVGNNVNSLSASGTIVISGTSMATPQVSSLAAYLLAIDPGLSPQRVIDILLDTSDTPGTTGSPDCSDFLTPAPAINAYAAVLALDEASALSGTASDAPVRLAILDAVDGGGNEGSNGRFDENDLEFFIEKIDAGTAELDESVLNVRHSRADLNGDGFDGGSGGEYVNKFNLDIDYPPTYTTVTQVIEEEEVEFNEASLSDNEILCYYAYSDLYTGSESQRRTLMAPRCRRGVMAVYVQYLRDQIAVPESGLFMNCPETPAVLLEERETFTTIPNQIAFPQPPFESRPANQYWSPGDIDAEINVRTVSGNRRYQTGFTGGGEPICVDVPFSTETEFNSTLEHDPNGNRLNVDVESRADAECKLPPGEAELDCASSFTRAGWIVEFDYALETSLNLTLEVQLSCSATSDRVPADPDIPNPQSIGDMNIAYSTSRYDASGERVSTIPAETFACPESGVVDIVRDISLPQPPPGDTENVVIRVSGRQDILVPFIEGVAEEGSTSIRNRMTGFAEVRPAD